MSAMAKSQHMVEMDKFSSSETVGVDFLYHVQTNVSVRRGSIWGITAHTIHNGGVLFFSNVYI